MVELNVETSAKHQRSRATELVSIQYLRGLAALGVVVWHASGEVGVAAWNGIQGGIEFFFLISGYVIWTISAERPPSPAQFLGKRFARVIPFYWAVTSFAMALLVLRPQWMQSLRFDRAHVIASYLFLPWRNPTPGVGLRPLVIPGWTLNYEMFFYTLFAGALFLPRRWRAAALIGVLLSLASLGAWIGPSGGGSGLYHIGDAVSFYTSPLLAEIALGVGLGVLLRKRAPSWRVARPMLVLGVALFAIGGQVWDGRDTTRLILLCLPAALVLVALVALERAHRLMRIPLLKRIGDASYAIYMIHPLLLSALVQLWRRIGAPAAAGPLYVALSVVAACAVGFLIHLTVEKPLSALLRRRPKPPASPRAKRRWAWPAAGQPGHPAKAIRR